MKRNGMWNEKKLMEWNGNGMKVVESLWNGMIENCYGMEWKLNSNFQDFGSLFLTQSFFIFSKR